MSAAVGCGHGRQHRYPGTVPFADSELDSSLFFGREDESRELLHQLLGTNLLVLHGKSGLGKTSLLQAALFPLLRERGHLPVAVRLNDPDAPVVEAVIGAVEQTCAAGKVEYTPGERTSLWTFFKTAVFWHDGDLMTPVLVLDQFEELFTLHGTRSRAAVVGQLGDLLGGRIPDEVRARRRAGEMLHYSDAPPAVRVILSLRESHLGELEALSGELPKVLESRFRLAPMSRDAARRAIVNPGSRPRGTAFITPRLHYPDQVLEGMLTFLADTTGAVEPFVLQVLCRRVEDGIAARGVGDEQEEVSVRERDVGGRDGMQAVVDSFYRDAVERIASGRERRRVKSLCAEFLLNASGRRVSVDAATLVAKCKVRQATLDRLVEARVLRRERRLDSHYYELSHDRLAQPALNAKPFRVSPVQAAWLTVGVVTLSLVLVGAIFWGYQKDRYAEQVAQERDRKIELLVAVEAERDRNKELLEEVGAEQQRNQKMLDEMNDSRMKLERLLRGIGRLDLLGDLNERLRQRYRDRAAQDKATLDERNNLAASLLTNGDILNERGDYGGALQDFTEARGVWERLVKEDPQRDIFRTNHVTVLERIGRFRTQRGEFEPASEAICSALNDLESIDPERRRSNDYGPRRAALLEAGGDIRLARGQTDAAWRMFDEERSIWKELAEQQRDDESRHGLAWAGIRLGDVRLLQGRTPEAENEFMTAMQILADMRGPAPSAAFFQSAFNEFPEVLGASPFGAKSSPGDQQEIPEGAPKTAAISIDFQNSLAMAEARVGDVHLGRFELEKAWNRYTKTATYLESQGDGRRLDQQRLRALSEVYRKIGSVHMAGYEQVSSLRAHMSAWNRYGEATGGAVQLGAGTSAFATAAEQAGEFYDVARHISYSLVARDTENWRWLGALGESELDLGQVLEAAGKPHEALTRYEAAIHVGRDLVEAAADYDAGQRLLAKALIRRGRLKAHLGEWGEAEEAHKQALGHANHQIARRPAPLECESPGGEKAHHEAGELAGPLPVPVEWYVLRAQAIDGLADALLGLGDHVEAADGYMEALVAREELVERTPDHAARKLDLALSLYKLARVERLNGEAHSARERMRLASRLAGELRSAGRLPPLVADWATRFEP